MHTASGRVGGAEHLSALSSPQHGHERAIVVLLGGWYEFAQAHSERHNALIGRHTVLGPEWQAVGLGLRGMLRGEECGRLERPLLQLWIMEMMRKHGVDMEMV